MSSVIDKYLEAIRKATSAPGNYAYRGQANSKWELRASATRRLLKEEGDEDAKKKRLQEQGFIREYTDYHRELIDRARTGGFGIEEGREVTDLQLLAKLQHFRAATGLLDFTRSSLVALWFASEKFDDKDGAIFIVNTNDPMYVKKILDKRDLDLRAILSSQRDNHDLDPGAISSVQPNLAYLEPTLSGDAKSRILSQRSLFIIGRPSIPDEIIITIDIDIKDRQADTPVAAAGKIIKITIKEKDKEKLREYLNDLDFNESSLFRGDIYGFAQVERVESPLPPKPDANQYLIQGNTSLQQGEYAKAIEYYNQAIDQDKGLFEAYNNRGNAKSSLGRHEDAIVDYDKAIELKPDYAEVHYNRGNAKYRLGEHAEAIAGYDKAIDLKPDYADAYNNRGTANWHLGHEDKARQDLEKALSLAVAAGNEDLAAKIKNALAALDKG